MHYGLRVAEWAVALVWTLDMQCVRSGDCREAGVKCKYSKWRVVKNRESAVAETGSELASERQ